MSAGGGAGGHSERTNDIGRDEEAMTSDSQVEVEEQITFRSTTDRPVYKLSVRLIDTYKHINKVFLFHFQIANHG